MSSNVRVVLALLVLVGGVAFFAFYATQDPPAVPDGPSERGEPDTIAPPPVREGRPGVLTGQVRVFRTGEPAADIEIRIESASERDAGVSTRSSPLTTPA